MRILLFLFGILELAAAVAWFCLVFAICESPPADQSEARWRLWAWCSVVGVLPGALIAITHVFFPARRLRIVGMILQGATLALAIPLGVAGVDLVASASHVRGEWGGLGIFIEGVLGIGSAVILAGLALFVLILLAATAPKRGVAA